LALSVVLAAPSWNPQAVADELIPKVQNEVTRVENDVVNSIKKVENEVHDILERDAKNKDSSKLKKETDALVTELISDINKSVKKAESNVSEWSKSAEDELIAGATQENEARVLKAAKDIDNEIEEAEDQINSVVSHAETIAILLLNLGYPEMEINAKNGVLNEQQFKEGVDLLGADVDHAILKVNKIADSAEEEVNQIVENLQAGA